MLDCEGILRAEAFGRRVRQEQAAAIAWEERADALERELAQVRAEAAAADAGRLAQIRSLRVALDRVAPMDPVLRLTGRTYASGERERVWQAPYVEAYDAVADVNDVPRCRRAMTKEELAAAAEAEVLAEPVRVTWFLWSRRYWWRGAEHRTAAGAIRAREADARAASRAWDDVGPTSVPAR